MKPIIFSQAAVGWVEILPKSLKLPARRYPDLPSTTRHAHLFFLVESGLIALRAVPLTITRQDLRFLSADPQRSSHYRDTDSSKRFLRFWARAEPRSPRPEGLAHRCDRLLPTKSGVRSLQAIQHPSGQVLPLNGFSHVIIGPQRKRLMLLGRVGVNAQKNTR